MAGVVDVLTTCLELVGAILVITAVALWLAAWSVPLALAVAGVLLVVLSGVVTWLSGRRRK